MGLVMGSVMVSVMGSVSGRGGGVVLVLGLLMGSVGRHSVGHGVTKDSPNSTRKGKAGNRSVDLYVFPSLEGLKSQVSMQWEPFE